MHGHPRSSRARDALCSHCWLMEEALSNNSKCPNRVFENEFSKPDNTCCDQILQKRAFLCLYIKLSANDISVCLLGGYFLDVIDNTFILIFHNLWEG